MIDLLRRADGASIVDLTQATGWLAHTTRAAITGLRKRGYAVARERSEAGKSVYRVSGAPAGSGDRVVQTDAVDGRRDPKRKTKRAAAKPPTLSPSDASLPARTWLPCGPRRSCRPLRLRFGVTAAVHCLRLDHAISAAGRGA